MITFSIEYDLSQLKELADKFADTVQNAPEAALPNTANAFRMAAQYVHNMWTGYLMGNQPLEGVEYLDNVTSAMVRSIKTRQNGDFNYSVISDNMQLAQAQNGRKEVQFDMKQKYPYGRKSRVSKKGIPYLIIPFRWKTPQKSDKLAHSQYFSSIVPTKYYNTALKGMEISSKNALKNYFEKNFKGENIERQGYNWAKFGRLTEDQSWIVDKGNGKTYSSAGMVRMKDVTGSTYFTFRIISAKSPAGSWIYHRDGKPGVNMIGALERTVKPTVDKMISEGIQADNQMYQGQ